MLRVLTFGGLALDGGGGSSRLSVVRPQGLALVARLAVAGARGVSREKLVGCFWPEKDEHSALHSLSQAMHRLRTELGVDGAIAGTHVLRLDPECLASDVGDFEEARRARDERRMIELYAGPFLDGFFLTGAAGFDRWVEEERRRLAELHSDALRTLAARAVSNGDHGDA